MAIPTLLDKNLRLPAIAAPMFLVSGADLVIAACRAGIIGTFPSLNLRTVEDYDTQLTTIGKALGPHDAPYGVNLIVHKTNPRLKRDLEVTIKHRVPLVITSLGAVRDVVDAVHGYAGVVFHDVIKLRHAQKAAEAGVDGLILVCGGAGGHAGTLNPFAFLEEIRSWFDGTLILAGCICNGAGIAAARAMGADLAYMGTRFINTMESLALPAYKDMIAQSGAGDIVYTKAISGVHANFLRRSLMDAGLDPDDLPEHGKLDLAAEANPEARAWKTIWSAGQGAAGVTDVLPVSDLVTRLAQEYNTALAQAPTRT